MENVNLIFITLKNVVNDRLSPLGFLIIREENHPEVFGSRYVDFQSENQVFRLIWDGKDKWFLLQFCNDILKYPFQDWKVIVVLPFDVHQSDIKEKEYVSNLEKPFENFLSEFSK